MMFSKAESFDIIYLINKKEVLKMKIMIASDIHGSAVFCKMLIDAYKAEGADRLLLLGDILYHGPRNSLPEGYDPRTVCDLLNAEKDNILCVRGNCDTEVDQMVLDFPILAEYCLLCFDNRAVYAAHGHHCGENDPPMLKKGDLLVCGHTHVPKCVDKGGFIYMNPGSVSIPKENSQRGYMILTESYAEWKTLDGKTYMEHKLL